MKTEQEERQPKIDVKEKTGAKRAVKQRLHEYSAGIEIKREEVKEANIPCSRCGAVPSYPGRPGIWKCKEHLSN